MATFGLVMLAVQAAALFVMIPLSLCLGACASIGLERLDKWIQRSERDKALWFAARTTRDKGGVWTRLKLWLVSVGS
ncbi:MAG TPA: hypothetical protein PLN52_01685 [Opitutaceae bacterium]|nr:hypothetical protein [Opitutaceae bacterium]